MEVSWQKIHEEVKPYGVEYSIKISPEGLNPYRVIKAYQIHDYPDEISDYISKNYPKDLVDFYNTKNQYYEDVILGVDGKAGVKKIYLEKGKLIKSIEAKGDERKYKIYAEQDNPRMHISWECIGSHDNPTRLNTVSFALFKPIKNNIDILINLCMKYAPQYINDFKYWLKNEIGARLNWLGISNSSFTIYYDYEI
jgi:hypothetical protein